MSSSPLSLARRGFPNKERAFSLVEVVLAIGVVAFAFVAILGLLPAGMTQFRQAVDTTVCAQIAQRVIGDAQQTDFDTLIDVKNLPSSANDRDNYTFRAPKVSEPEYRYFDERGGEVIPSSKAARANPDVLSAKEKAQIVYHVNIRVMPETAIPKTNSGGGATQLATLTIQIANNPGNRRIAINGGAKDNKNEPKRQLFVKTPGMTILTYSAQVARNQ